MLVQVAPVGGHDVDHGPQEVGLLGDPGRAYLPRDGLTAFATYVVPTSLELEDRTEREVTLYGLAPG